MRIVIPVEASGITNQPHQLALNEIGLIEIKLGNPIFADMYTSNPRNGAFILIDEQTNATVGVGFVEAT